MRTVNEVSKLTGISVRTLHYYDEIGLLKPIKCKDNGYRLYDEKALEKLQQILFFREFDMPLKEIKSIMENPAQSMEICQAYGNRVDSITKKLVKHKEESTSSFEVKSLIGEYGFIMKQLYQIPEEKPLMVEIASSYEKDDRQREMTDKQYGTGAADYIAKAIREFYR